MNLSDCPSSICVSNFYLVQQIAFFLDISDLLVFETLNKLCSESVKKIYNEINESKAYKYLSFTSTGFFIVYIDKIYN